MNNYEWLGKRVRFGRPNGEQTRGVVVKCNQKKAKVRIDTPRGIRSQAGAEWGVPYSMLRLVDENDIVLPSAAVIEKRQPLVYNQFSRENTILEAILGVYSDLSPENLSCDGELPYTQVRQRAANLQRQLKGLIYALGRDVSESEIYEWDRSRREASKAS